MTPQVNMQRYPLAVDTEQQPGSKGLGQLLLPLLGLPQEFTGFLRDFFDGPREGDFNPRP